MQLRLMTFAIATLVLSAIIDVGCTGQSNSYKQSGAEPKALHVSLALKPDPIRLGHEEATVTVTDSSGTAVPGADVAIMTGMPVMKMNVLMEMPNMGHAGKTYHPTDVGDGSYRADVNITMPTRWDFVVQASSRGGAYGTALYEAQVSGTR